MEKVRKKGTLLAFCFSLVLANTCCAIETTQHEGPTIKQAEPNGQDKEVTKVEKIQHPDVKSGFNVLGGGNWKNATRVIFSDGSTMVLPD